ncbi:MAG: LOG family protein [Angelakisella sp.]
MIELGDAFIAFPGGLGTLEEISEVMSRVALHKLSPPASCITWMGTTRGCVPSSPIW